MFSFPWAWKDGGKDPCVNDLPFSIVEAGLTVVAMAGDAPFALSTNSFPYNLLLLLLLFFGDLYDSSIPFPDLLVL